MKRIKKSISLVLALLMLASVCTVVPITVSAKSKKPYLNAKSVTLGVGENTVLELKNTNSNVTFESSNDKIVYVNSDGEIGSAGYGKIGTVTITAKSGGNTYKCKVKIQKKATKHAPKTSGDYQYSLLEDGTVQIYWYKGKNKNIVIPQKINGYKVTRIGSGAFTGQSITSVTIPNGIKSIGGRTFSSCSKLKSVKFSKTIESIGWNAFAYCSSLKKINLVKGVKYIRSGAFMYCTKLNKITIPNSVKIIEESAFEYCSKLNNISIPKSVIMMDNAFQGNTFKKISVNKSNRKYTSVAGVLYNKNKTKLIAYPTNKSVTSFKVPNGVVELSEGCFIGANKLKTITLSDTVERIKSNAFSSCKKLSEVNLSKNLNSIEGNPFAKIGVTSSGLTEITITEENKYFSTENGVLYNKDKTKLVIYPAGKKATKFTVSETVTELGEYSFDGTQKIKSVTLPDKLKKIGKGAFSNCKALTKITIPEKITVLYEYTFAECYNISSVVIPKSVKTIKAGAFSSAGMLSDVCSLYYKGSQSEWKKIKIGKNNDYFDYVTRFNYNYTE